MENFLSTAMYITEYLAGELWLPLAIWTVIAMLLLAGVKKLPAIHPHYHYQIRLAALLSLPAGLSMMMLLQGFEWLLTAGAAEPYNLKLITVQAPLEMGVTAAAGGTHYSPAKIFLMILSLFIIMGIIFSLCSLFWQWYKLSRLCNAPGLRGIEKVELLSPSNKILTERIDKNIRIGFSASEIIPVTFGTKNPVILMPESLNADSEKLNLAIRHELLHIARNDYLSHMAVLFTRALFWFHPLVYPLKNEIIEYRELRCDAELLSEKTVSPKMYAELLLELIPASNLQKNIPVNMAQESSNLKKRIEMIVNESITHSLPKQKYAVLFSSVLLAAAVVMACTDMQTDTLYDEEELEIITRIDRSGDRGGHEIIIFMGDEEQSERHDNSLARLQQIEPDHIESVTVLKGESALNEFGSRGKEGVIVITTKPQPDSFNAAMKVLGLNTLPPEEFRFTADEDSAEDFFIVVEEMPELIGGLGHLLQNLNYPESARREGIEGRVHVQFVVTEQGDVENARVVRSVGGGLDEEALRVIRQAKFTPGYQRGRPVRVQYALPIFFRLSESEPAGDASR